MIRYTLTITMILVGLALTAGCGWTKQPVAKVRGVRIAESGADGVRAELLLELTNLNPNEPLPMTIARYRVELDGVGRYQSNIQPLATIPARGRQQIVLPAGIAASNAAADRTPYRVTGTIEYQPSGNIRELLTDIGVPLPTVSFSHTGTAEPAAGFSPSAAANAAALPQ